MVETATATRTTPPGRWLALDLVAPAGISCAAAAVMGVVVGGFGGEGRSIRRLRDEARLTGGIQACRLRDLATVFGGNRRREIPRPLPRPLPRRGREWHPLTPAPESRREYAPGRIWFGWSATMEAMTFKDQSHDHGSRCAAGIQLRHRPRHRPHAMTAEQLIAALEAADGASPSLTNRLLNSCCQQTFWRGLSRRPTPSASTPR